MKPILILGIGNVLMGDDAIGLRVIEALRRESVPEEVELLTGECGGLDLVDDLAHRRKVVVVDAMNIDAAPGTVCRVMRAGLAEDPARVVSQHEFGLVAALEACRQLKCEPAEVVVIGIQPKEMGFHLGLCPEVEAMIPAAVKAVLKEVEGAAEVH